MRTLFIITTLLLIENAYGAETLPPPQTKAEEIRAEYEKWESQNGGAALNEKQVRAYANDARCLLKMHCFNDEVYVIGNDAFLEKKSDKRKDICKQTVVHSPEKIYVRTHCFRIDEDKSYELMENVLTFSPPPKKE